MLRETGMGRVGRWVVSAVFVPNPCLSKAHFSPPSLAPGFEGYVLNGGCNPPTPNCPALTRVLSTGNEGSRKPWT